MSTRTVRMWIDNDEYLYNEQAALVEQVVALSDSRDEAVDLLATKLEMMIEEHVGIDNLTGLAYDLMRAGLEEVDWSDLAYDALEETDDSAWEDEEEAGNA